MNKDEQVGGRGYKIGSFKRTYFLNDPLRIKTLEAVVRMLFKIGVLKNFANVTGKQLCWSLFLITLQAFNFIRKRLEHRCFPVEFLKKTFFHRTYLVAA